MENNEQPKTKVCKKCGQELPLEYFSKNTRAKDGLQIYCKDCQKALVKEKRGGKETKQTCSRFAKKKSMAIRAKMGEKICGMRKPRQERILKHYPIPKSLPNFGGADISADYTRRLRWCYEQD